MNRSRSELDIPLYISKTRRSAGDICTDAMACIYVLTMTTLIILTFVNTTLIFFTIAQKATPVNSTNIIAFMHRLFPDYNMTNFAMPD